jgi:hypothetical protein
MLLELGESAVYYAPFSGVMRRNQETLPRRAAKSDLKKV